ncbi:hypothetical protein [Chitinimonas taiwanensis]|uniref:ENTH domain-containing protein n=1 Tax=Chitinimonas taiwanensis DSM 18899 TaxID=1121279 RepID=A0A1K2HD98_9NEIS|nr:hypothetical protein [Chitinimonas taiwanensis]SFZ74719.1 hypothetical protein SAMN02745887_01374 [Chitinimonas taiwanensis DSM 18899]
MAEYRDLFGKPDNKPQMRDLFGAQPPAPEGALAPEPAKSVPAQDLFAGQAPSLVKTSAVDLGLLTPLATPTLAAPESIATREGVDLRYAELVRENEVLMHRVIDLTQSVKHRENQLSKLLNAARQQADELQAIINPKRSLLGKKPAVDKARAHALIDELQGFMRSELKPDVFFQNDMEELRRQTDYLDRLAAVLKADAQTVLLPNDELLERISTQSHILSLQANSTRRLIEQLERQLQDIEDWRANFLSLLVVDIQQRL